MAIFYVTPCQGGDQIEVNDNGLILGTGDVISFSSSTGDVTCGTVGGRGNPGDTSYTAITIFDNCDECIIDIPRSANTTYEICEVCFDGSVVTVYNLTPPHPVYTDGYGTPVTQLNMVTLGGPNGLNS